MTSAGQRGLVYTLQTTQTRHGSRRHVRAMCVSITGSRRAARRGERSATGVGGREVGPDRISVSLGAMLCVDVPQQTHAVDVITQQRAPAWLRRHTHTQATLRHAVKVFLPCVRACVLRPVMFVSYKSVPLEFYTETEEKRLKRTEAH